MIVRILSFNVRGLNDKSSIPLLHNYLHSQSQIDVVLLQEHKLRNQDSANLGKNLWSSATSWSADATVGYNNAPLSSGAGKGGILMMITPRLVHMVSRYGTLLENRAQWILL